MRKRHPARCPVCADHKLQACPDCNGTGKALCHRCLDPVYNGDWASREDMRLKASVPLTVFFCRKCAEEIGIVIGPRIRLVA
jgi:hypothetical protein